MLPSPPRFNVAVTSASHITKRSRVGSSLLRNLNIQAFISSDSLQNVE